MKTLHRKFLFVISKEIAKHCDFIKIKFYILKIQGAWCAFF